MCLNFARSPKLFLRSQSVVLARSLGCPPPADECATVSLSLSSRIFAWPVFHPLGGITRSSVPATSSFVERVDGSYGSKDISVKNRGSSLPPLPPLLADSTRSRRRKKNEVYTRTFNRGNRYRLEGIYKLGVKSVDGIPTMHSLIRSEK